MPILSPDYSSNQQFYLKGRFEKKSFCIHDDAYYDNKKLYKWLVGEATVVDAKKAQPLTFKMGAIAGLERDAENRGALIRKNREDEMRKLAIWMSHSLSPGHKSGIITATGTVSLSSPTASTTICHFILNS